MMLARFLSHVPTTKADTQSLTYPGSQTETTFSTCSHQARRQAGPNSQVSQGMGKAPIPSADNLGSNFGSQDLAHTHPHSHTGEKHRPFLKQGAGRQGVALTSTRLQAGLPSDFRAPTNWNSTQPDILSG